MAYTILILNIYFLCCSCTGFCKNYNWLAGLFNKYIKPFLTWRILICYLPFWFLATGWAWLFSVIGRGWLRGAAITWLGILWLPICPEKVVTIPLAIWLHTKIFPKHSVPKVLTETLKNEKQKLKKAKKK